MLLLLVVAFGIAALVALGVAVAVVANVAAAVVLVVVNVVIAEVVIVTTIILSPLSLCLLLALCCHLLYLCLDLYFLSSFDIWLCLHMLSTFLSVIIFSIYGRRLSWRGPCF